jgi:hypothetical protein
MRSPTIVLLGRVLDPGPTLTYDATGLPRGRFTLRLDDSGLAVVVETWGEHAKWTAGRLHPDERVLVVGCRRAGGQGRFAVDGWRVEKVAAVSAVTT